MEKKITIDERALGIIQEHAIRDLEDIIHDITGAPIEALLALGVNREIMLTAANEAMRAVKGISK